MAQHFLSFEGRLWGGRGSNGNSPGQEGHDLLCREHGGLGGEGQACSTALWGNVSSLAKLWQFAVCSRFITAGATCSWSTPASSSGDAPLGGGSWSLVDFAPASCLSLDQVDLNGPTPLHEPGHGDPRRKDLEKLSDCLRLEMESCL